jgi:hypothetical protein
LWSALIAGATFMLLGTTKSVSVAILLMLIVTSYLQAAFVLTKSHAFSGDSSHDVS